MAGYGSFQEYSKSWDDRYSAVVFAREYKNNWAVGLQASKEVMDVYDWVSLVQVFKGKAAADLIMWGVEQQIGTLSLEDNFENLISEIGQQVDDIDKNVSSRKLTSPTITS